MAGEGVSASIPSALAVTWAESSRIAGAGMTPSPTIKREEPAGGYTGSSQRRWASTLAQGILCPITFRVLADSEHDTRLVFLHSFLGVYEYPSKICNDVVQMNWSNVGKIIRSKFP
ncbi:hypothetical protein K438DRAFT_1782099 [Mycena galopus ATCC 62051]|nr:hypothetical protein K438DRAFT_1782099 [Mycena galopus ATCC 62051]